MSAPSAYGHQAGRTGEAAQGVYEVTLRLCSAQVQAVVEQAMAPPLAGALAAARPDAVASTLKPLLQDGACSRSVVRALIILASFPPDGSERELTAIAAEVGLSGGTTHRYLYTLTVAGLLRRDSNSRRYHRPHSTAPQAGGGRE